MDPLQSESPALKEKTSLRRDSLKVLHDEFKGDSMSADRQKRSDSPEPSCLSMRSDRSKDLPIAEFQGDCYTQDRPEPSCLSMRSDKSKDQPTDFQTDHDTQDRPEPSCLSMRSDKSKDPPTDFQTDHDTQDRSIILEGKDLISVVSKNEQLEDSQSAQCGNQLKFHLMTKFKLLHEGTKQQGNPTLLNEIYTELYITEHEEISDKDEISQIVIEAKRAATQSRPIKYNDIFKPLPGQNQLIRTVLTKGFAGIGKTVSVQKFILDWAEGKANQDVHLIFPLPFRELNLIKDQTFSLKELLRAFFPKLQYMDIFSDKYKMLLIFDGLDECRYPFDFHTNERLWDVKKETSVDVLLTNLITGNLLPSALIWITSRPAAADLIPSECVHRVTEVRGFNDPQKEEYFRKRITDESLANTIISHLKSSRSLYIMCHIPVFSWISATVLEKMLSEAESGEIPKTLTQMYTHFLVLQSNIKHEKDFEMKVKDEDMILKLGKLAFQQLMRGNVIFYEEALRECGLDVTEASVYSGLCTQIFSEEFGLCEKKIYCFVHLSIQEHLAALYVHHTFTSQNINVIDQITEPTPKKTPLSQIPIFELHRSAVEETLKSKHEHLGLFLRFLLGFSLESSQTLLTDLLKLTESSSHNLEETIKYIKKKIEEHPTPDKFINLFHCLNDLGDTVLVEQVHRYLIQRALTTVKFTPLQWSAVVFVLLTSKSLDVFELKKYAWKTNCSQTSQVLLNLQPVIEASRSAQFGNCEFTPENCAALAKVLTSKSSYLKELNLKGNELKDSGVKLLSKGLGSPYCKLKILNLKGCGVTERGCADLASALRLNSTHLRQLLLSFNEIGDEGVKNLSDVLRDPLCGIEKLSLKKCGLSNEGCEALASALTSNPSHLRELDLSKNSVGHSVTLLSGALRNTECKLEILRLKECGITCEGSIALSSVLRSNLKELDLSENTLGNSGISFLSDAPKCLISRLEELWLVQCDITYEGCDGLASALELNLPKLKELNLSGNVIGDSGLKRLSKALENPHCQLETLGLNDCGITGEGCSALISALTSNPTHLSKLHLFGNNIGESTMEKLSDLQNQPKNKLNKVNLGNTKHDQR